MVDVRRIDEHHCRLGEGPIWDEDNDRLLWCDITAGEIHAIAADGSGKRVWTLPDRVGSFGIGDGGRWVVALTKAVHLFDPETGALEKLADIEADVPHTRLNDGKVGPDGAFWVGTMDERPDRQPVGSLYRVTADGTVEKKVEGVYVSNGLAWTPDGRTMFYSDSRGPWIDRFAFDPATGAISDRTRIVTVASDADGRPDGANCDAEGAYWSAGVSGAVLNRFDRDGKLLARIPVPVATPTMPCFGGPGYRTMFVTSIGDGLAADRRETYPWTGALIALEPGVAGVAGWKFKEA